MIFVSHAHSDAPLASDLRGLVRRVCDSVTRVGWFVSSDPQLYRPEDGPFRDQHISAGLVEADLMICLITENYLSSRYCLSELGASRTRSPFTTVYVVRDGIAAGEGALYPLGGLPWFALDGDRDVWEERVRLGLRNSEEYGIPGSIRMRSFAGLVRDDSPLLEVSSVPLIYGTRDQHIPVALTSRGRAVCAVRGGRPENTSPMNARDHIEPQVEKHFACGEGDGIDAYLEFWPQNHEKLVEAIYNRAQIQKHESDRQVANLLRETVSYFKLEV